MKTPEIGDTVVINGTVEGHGTNGNILIKTISGNHGDCHLWVNTSRLSEVIPKPYEPKVGDKLRYCQRTTIYTLAAIFNGNWAVTWGSKQHEYAVIDPHKQGSYTLCAD